MRYKVLIGISFISFVTITCEGIGISSKLDFGDSPSSSSLIGTPTRYRSSSVPHTYTRTEERKKNDDFGGIGVVCVSGGCNTTKSGTDSKDSIETDVVVHVKTTVDLNKNNKTNVIDDIPDIPILVGTAGTGGDSQSRTYNQGHHFVSDFDPFSDPSFSPPIAPTSSSSLTPSFVSPSFSPVYSSPSLLSDSVYVHSANLPPEHRVDINIKTLPSVSLTMTDDGRGIKDISPPPQLVWYPKTSGLVNTVDYKPKTASWKPSVWSGGTTGGTPHRHLGSGNTCYCKNQPNTGLQWHPSRKIHQDPGVQIDDKLGNLS